jgi:HD superfamily phosphohydrolase
VARRAEPSKRKSIFDPVHGVVTLSGAPLALIGDPAFQRLWGIRQTGLAHLVFPGANHTRLEHSLGVYWVARQMAERLGLGEASLAAVQAGGLLHDLGHAPLSHTLDAPMQEVLGVDHERRSRDIITGREPMTGTGPLRTPSEIPQILERAGVRPGEVADLIDPSGGPRGDRIETAILHGAIDADRIDYLQRDAHYTGVAHGVIDAARLLETVRAHAGRLVWAEKGLNAVEGFLVGRSLMYSAVYYHKTVRAAEVMAQAAVERLPAYPGSAREIFDGTDGDLFALLDRAGGRSSYLAGAIRGRHLYKRVHVLRRLPKARRRAFQRLVRDPAGRRATEDELSERIGAAPGSVLVDLSGIGSRRSESAGWARVGLLEDHRVRYPFRLPGIWRALALRPPSHWPVSVYAAPRSAAAARGWCARHPALLD